jgi:hypothetical protein
MRTTCSLISFDWLTAAGNLLYWAIAALATFASAAPGEHLSGAIAFQTHCVVMRLTAFQGGRLWRVSRRIDFRYLVADMLRTAATGWRRLAGFMLAGMGDFDPARLVWVRTCRRMGVARLPGGRELPHKPPARSSGGRRRRTKKSPGSICRGQSALD